jgi:hypothetical protein
LGGFFADWEIVFFGQFLKITIEPKCFGYFQPQKKVLHSPGGVA